MILQPILALIVLRSLRKSLKTAGLLAKWDKIFMFGTAFFIALIVVNIVARDNSYIIWVSHALILGLVYMIFTEKEFRSAKPVMFAVLPLIIINLIEDVVKLINHDFYKKWDNYFETGGLFAVVWMGAMLII